MDFKTVPSLEGGGKAGYLCMGRARRRGGLLHVSVFRVDGGSDPVDAHRHLVGFPLRAADDRDASSAGTAARTDSAQSADETKTRDFSGIAIPTVAEPIADFVDGRPSLPVHGQSSDRSEERRVGKECRIGCRSRWSPYH